MTEGDFQRQHVLTGDGKTAIVIGATGATGSKVVEQLLQNPEWTKVVTIGRRPLEVEHDKLVQVQTQMDKESLVAHKGVFRGVDVLFNCIGTTRAAAKSAEKFVEIEVGITESTAEIAKEQGIPHYSVVSARGANSNVWSVNWIHMLLYTKTLGQKQDAVINKQFPKTSIFQPGFLKRMRGDRPAEKYFGYVFSGLSVETLATAMIRDAESPPVPAEEAPEKPVIYTGNALITRFALLD